MINTENIIWSIDTIKGLLREYGDYPALYAISPINEPWLWSDLTVLKTFFRDVRNDIRNHNPNLIFVFDTYAKQEGEFWNDLFDDDDMENVVFDTHKYLAFGDGGDVWLIDNVDDLC